MEVLRFTTAGSVDDGKSTLIGRLLYDSKAIYEDQLKAIERASIGRGQDEVDLSLLTDGLRAEREQRITIDVAYRYFSTPKRKFIIADTPGHIQYTRNMVTGASTAELAIILVDARNGVITQTKRHAFIASLLQIPYLVVAVNKMDLVDYDRQVYEQIREDFNRFLTRLSVHDVTFIPISALKGDNVVDRSTRMDWYQGRPLLRHLERVRVGSGVNRVDFRLPVQYVVRPTQDFRGFAGQVASGRVRPGDEVMALPSRKLSRVKAIHYYTRDLEEAFPGDSVVVRLEDEIDISRGDMLVRHRNLPETSSDLDVTICWMNEEPLRLGGSYLLSHTTKTVRAYVEELNYRIDVDTMHREDAEALELNEIGRARLTTTLPLHFDPYNTNRATGSFILIDEATNVTVGAGMIRGSADELEPEQPVSIEQLRNVTPVSGSISLQSREERNQHRAGVIWLTGLSASGKSTLARALEVRLFSLGCATQFLDGDNLRAGLNQDLGFDRHSRAENIRRVAEVARLGYLHGGLVICSFISPLAQMRTQARDIIGEDRFLEVFVNCPLEVCIQRDPKGLYKRAQSGEIPDFTGIGSPYEAPENPAVELASSTLSVDEQVESIIEALRKRKWLPAAGIDSPAG